MSGFETRLRELMRVKNLKTVANLASYVGVSWSTAAQWLDGTTPRKIAIEHLAKQFGVTSKWLAGEGAETPSRSNSTEQAIERILDILPDLLADAKLALDTVENGKSPVFRKAAAEWLASIGQSIHAEIVRMEREEVPQ